MSSQPHELVVLSALLRLIASRILVFMAFLATLALTYVGLALL